MTITAPVDLGITAASSLPPWSAKVQRLCAMCILFGNGLRGWGYLLNLLCLLTGAATGAVGIGIIKAPTQGETLEIATASLGFVHFTLQLLSAYLSLESRAKAYATAVRQLRRLQHEDEDAFDDIYARIPYVPLDRDGDEQAAVPGMPALLMAGRALLILGLYQPCTSFSMSSAARDPPQP